MKLDYDDMRDLILRYTQEALQNPHPAVFANVQTSILMTHFFVLLKMLVKQGIIDEKEWEQNLKKGLEHIIEEKTSSQSS